VPLCLLAIVAAGFPSDKHVSGAAIDRDLNRQTHRVAQSESALDHVDAKAVFVRGSQAFVAVGSQVVIVEISDRMRPTVTGHIRAFSDSVQDVMVVDDLAYVAAGDSGLSVVDVSDASAPTVKGTYDSPGAASGIHVDGGRAYLADSWGGPQVVDVSDSRSPTPLGRVRIPRALAVRVVGHHAYVAAEEGGLRIVDVSDATAPVEVGSYSAGGDVNDVAVIKNVAYLAAGGGGLEIVDVTRPTAPQRVGAYTEPYGKSLQVMNGHVFLATERSGLWIIDISSAANPVGVSRFDTIHSANDVYLDGPYAFVATGRSGLRVIDASNPVTPVALN
jgi:hypothetical protein